MALTRKFLSALGIDADKVDEIITAHSETVDALKEQRDSYKDDAEKLPEVQRELDKYKKMAEDNEGDDWKSKYEAEKKAFADYKDEVKNKETMAAKKSAVEALAKDFLSENGVAKAIKYADWDAYELDENGKLIDAKKHIKDLKEEWSDYVLKDETKGANTVTPPDNNGGQVVSMKDIYKKDENGRYVLNAQERRQAIIEAKTKGDE